MTRTKQHITLVALVFSFFLVLAAFSAGWIHALAAAVLVSVGWAAYRLIMKYLRRCAHCGSIRVERRHYRQPHGSHGSNMYLCDTFRTCRNPHCAYYGIEDLEKSYTKVFGRVHERVLRFAGLL